MSELFFDVPKDYSKPADGNLRLFARSVERVEKPSDGAKEEKKHVPWCKFRVSGVLSIVLANNSAAVVYLQGMIGLCAFRYLVQY